MAVVFWDTGISLSEDGIFVCLVHHYISLDIGFTPLILPNWRRPLQVGVQVRCVTLDFVQGIGAMCRVWRFMQGLGDKQHQSLVLSCPILHALSQHAPFSAWGGG